MPGSGKWMKLRKWSATEFSIQCTKLWLEVTEIILLGLVNTRTVIEEVHPTSDKKSRWLINIWLPWPKQNNTNQNKQQTNKQKIGSIWHISKFPHRPPTVQKKRHDTGKGKALWNSIRTLRLLRVRKHGGIAYLCATRSLKWLVSVQIVCVYRAVSLCYVTQTCVRINFMSSSLLIAEAASAALKKKKKKAGCDVLINEDVIGQWPPLY